MLYSKEIACLICSALVAGCAHFPSAQSKLTKPDADWFKTNSGLDFLSKETYGSLKMTGDLDPAFSQIRASVRLEEDELTDLLTHPFFDWWSRGKPPYKAWKGTVLFDGPSDGFIPEMEEVDYYIFLANSSESVRRMYVITVDVESGSQLFYYYLRHR